MHGDVTLAGPLWWVASAVLIGAVALAAFMAIDALRAARTPRFGELPESRWVYFGISVVYVAGALVAQLVRIAPVAIAVSLLSPLILALGLVYLLRVVFPKRTPTE